jgi:hypothetical protein
LIITPLFLRLGKKSPLLWLAPFQHPEQTLSYGTAAAVDRRGKAEDGGEEPLYIMVRCRSTAAERIGVVDDAAQNHIKTSPFPLLFCFVSCEACDGKRDMWGVAEYLCLKLCHTGPYSYF